MRAALSVASTLVVHTIPTPPTKDDAGALANEGTGAEQSTGTRMTSTGYGLVGYRIAVIVEWSGKVG